MESSGSHITTGQVGDFKGRPNTTVQFVLQAQENLALLFNTLDEVLESRGEFRLLVCQSAELWRMDLRRLHGLGF